MVGGQETGNETYVRGLVDGFSGLEQDFEVDVYHVGRPWRPGGPHLRFRQLASARPALRLTAQLPLLSLLDRLDVLHMSYTKPLWAGCPVVLAVHDVSFLAHPEWFSARDLGVLTRFVPWSIRRAARVVTISEICRSEILEHFRLAPEGVVNIPLAAGPAAQAITTEEAEAELTGLGLDPGRRYVLAVGNLQPRKNLTRLLAAYARLTAPASEVDLLIVGPAHFRADDVFAAARSIKERVHFTGYLSDRQLAACYRRAELFVLPSLYEGFGLPALEAMAHGVPVACSTGGALPEVCGDAAEYFDPTDVDALAGAIERVLGDRARWEQLVELGHQRERNFSWRRTATETLGVYRQAVRRDQRNTSS